MEIATDNDASSGDYIFVPEGKGNVWEPRQDGGYIEYVFEVPASGEYVIWGRVKAVDTNNDSFFVSIDEAEYALWDTRISNAWVWDQVANRGGDNPVVYYLEAGQHTLIFKQREDGTKLDRILVTNDMEYIPE